MAIELSDSGHQVFKKRVACIGHEYIRMTLCKPLDNGISSGVQNAVLHNILNPAATEVWHKVGVKVFWRLTIP
jgi:hypothetical protein